MRKTLLWGLGLALTSSAFAGFTFSDAGPIDTNGPAGNAVNGVRTFAFGGPAFQPGQFVIEGDLTEINTATFGNEARVRIIDPSGAFFDTPALTSTGGFTGTIHIGPTTVSGGAFNMANSVGTWTFRFFESFDDGGTTSLDAQWTNFSLRANDSIPPDTNQTIDLGALSDDGAQLCRRGDLRNAGILDTYNFSIANAVNNGDGTYLNIQTVDPVTGDTVDTEIGLFDSTGTCVATDDDGQITALGGLYSMLSHGDSDPYFNADTAAGVDGVLAAGGYSLIVGGFNTNFTLGMNISAVTGGASTGDYDICFAYVPEPTSLALLAVAGLLAIRRR